MFLEWFTRATVKMMQDLEDTFGHRPRYEPRK
jgi:hypothetical protein